jgi:hypothetical protein
MNDEHFSGSMVSGIENGIISCTVVHKPLDFGYLSSNELATGGEAFRTKLAEMKKQ